MPKSPILRIAPDSLFQFYLNNYCSTQLLNPFGMSILDKSTFTIAQMELADKSVYSIKHILVSIFYQGSVLCHSQYSYNFTHKSFLFHVEMYVECQLVNGRCLSLEPHQQEQKLYGTVIVYGHMIIPRSIAKVK